ncbi:DUF1653 domain-containing protein [Methylobacterium sp. AMS5]|uniref:DUF1653 domain-containing protein n=1 Tax=Methylobacterium sp. AMS5 TaxID=925818 RepID=UPI00074FA21C|nr:DUF1653 domain-containing protein [Methylobacterium sp. AMS5]AMB48331.1 hypothetical protein Y590_25520 [Methylobacterium sp. AMS5]
MSVKQLPPIPDHAPGNGSIWQHFRTGDLYTVLTVGRHSETLEPLVVYQPFVGEGDDAWIRSLAFSPENQWPGFLDLVGEDGKAERFRYVGGPQFRHEGYKDDSSGLGSLARLVTRAIELEEKGPSPERWMDQNPNWRRLLGVVRMLSEGLFEEMIEVEGPSTDPIPLDDVRQVLEVIRYEAKNPPDADRQARILSYANRALGIT